MKGRVVLLDHVGGREAAALMVDGRLEDLLVDAPEGSPPAPGAIYRAVAGRPMRGQGGAFVELGGGARGYLRNARGLSPGTGLVVQVGAAAEPGKAPPVSPRPMIRSRYAIVTPGAPGVNIARSVRDESERARLLDLASEALAFAPLAEGAGLILRSACDGVDAASITRDIAATVALASRVLADAAGAPGCLLAAPSAHVAAWRDWAVPEPDAVTDRPGCFEAAGVPEAVAAALAPDLALGGGATARLEPTRAFVAVDVDTGGDTSPAAGLKANLALARALPRALRIRGLGGAVVADLAPFPKGERRRVEDALRREIRLAGLEGLVAGWSSLGHCELQLRRDRLPLRSVWPR